MSSRPSKRSSSLDEKPLCEGDCCKGAVERAYREMKDQGQPLEFAKDAAFRVFRWHHPDIPVSRARDAVSLWLHEGTVH